MRNSIPGLKETLLNQTSVFSLWRNYWFWPQRIRYYCWPRN